MKDLFNRIKKDFYNRNSAKKYLFALSFIIVFLYFQRHINSFVENYLMEKSTYDSVFLDILIFGGCVIVFVFIYRKLIKTKYLPSNVEYFIVCSLLPILIFYRLNFNKQNWNLHNFIEGEDINIKYVDLIIILLSSYLLFNIWRYINIWKSAKNTKSKNNFLLSDDPIYNIDLDKLDYKPVVDQLSQILLNENHMKSISIGLIGPWGNGKSSVINMVKNKIETDQQFIDNDIISIHFLPYLNHNENDIINEFFTTLSNELSIYNGKLSNQLQLYSQKLTDLYTDKNLSAFLENQFTNFSKSSANDLYEIINRMLEEVGKKIIVYIDDLDRLNQNEILQILKLIRNTANFRNTFFVVAMDKEYVINRLKISEDILNAKFIDKFFQLEIYLPEINKTILRDYFMSELKRPYYAVPANFEIKLNEALNDRNLLFNDYVKNFRDAKRVVNQVKYDLSLYKEDFSYLNLKDFINFTFFKLKFPSYMKDFNDNRDDFLFFDRSKGTYNLIQVKKEDDEDSDNIYNFLNTHNINDIEYLKKYEIYNDQLIDDCKNEDKSITCEEKKILIKTLAFLFGDENKIEGTDSIKYENNFRMLMQQRIFKNYFKQSDFDELLTSHRESQRSLIHALEKEEKLVQLIDRLKYYNTNEESKIKSLIEILAILYEKRFDFNFNEVDILFLIEKFVNELFKIAEEKKIEKAQYSTWIKDFLFNNKNLLEETRLTLLGYLWKSKDLNYCWYVSEQFIKDKIRMLYKEYLDKYNDALWAVNDYKTYSIYHAIKKIDTSEVNAIFKDFWAKNPIELLCVQTVDLEAFSNISFRITDTVNEIFGSRMEFVNFVQSHRDKKLPAVREFLQLFNLIQITNYNRSIIFEFTFSKLMLEKIKYIKSYPGRTITSEDDNKIQLFIEFNNQQLSQKLLKAPDLFDKYLFKQYLHNNNAYIVITFEKQDFEEKVLQFLQSIAIIQTNSSKFILKGKSISENLILSLDDTMDIKILSIQPKLKDLNQINLSSN